MRLSAYEDVPLDSDIDDDLFGPDDENEVFTEEELEAGDAGVYGGEYDELSDEELDELEDLFEEAHEGQEALFDRDASLVAGGKARRVAERLAARGFSNMGLLPDGSEYPEVRPDPLAFGDVEDFKAAVNDWQKGYRRVYKRMKQRERAELIRNAPGTFPLPKADWEAVLSEHGYVCYWCGRGSDEAGTLAQDHYLPATRGGTNLPDNLVPACGSCNSAHGNKTPDEFYEYIEKKQRAGDQRFMYMRTPVVANAVASVPRREGISMSNCRASLYYDCLYTRLKASFPQPRRLAYNEYDEEPLRYVDREPGTSWPMPENWEVSTKPQDGTCRFVAFEDPENGGIVFYYFDYHSGIHHNDVMMAGWEEGGLDPVLWGEYYPYSNSISQTSGTMPESGSFSNIWELLPGILTELPNLMMIYSDYDDEIYAMTTNGWQEFDDMEEADQAFLEYERSVVGCVAEGSVRHAAGKYDGIDFKPSEGMVSAYKDGIKRHENGETGDGLEDATLTQAKKAVSGEAFSSEWVSKGARWWGRNERFLGEEAGSAAYAAAKLWGGAAGRDWFESRKNQMDKADEGGSGGSGESKESRMTIDAAERRVAGRIALAFGTSHERGEEIARIVLRVASEAIEQRPQRDRGGNFIYPARSLEAAIEGAQSNAFHFDHALTDFTVNRRRPGEYDAYCLDCGFDAYATADEFGGSACTYQCDPLDGV